MQKDVFIQTLQACNDENDRLSAIEKLVGCLEDNQVREKLCLTALITDSGNVRKRIFEKLQHYAETMNCASPRLTILSGESTPGPWTLVNLFLGSDRQDDALSAKSIMEMVRFFQRHQYTCIKTGLNCLKANLGQQHSQSLTKQISENREK